MCLGGYKRPVAPRCFKDRFWTPFALGLNAVLWVSVLRQVLRFAAVEFLANTRQLLAVSWGPTLEVVCHPLNSLELLVLYLANVH